MTVLTITVHGIPGAQGNHRISKAGVIYDSGKAVGPWREAVKAAALKAKPDNWTLITGPVMLEVNFHFPRLKGHYGTGKNAGKVKLSAPLYPAVLPDLSKIIRSTEDALTDAGIWRDDSLVVIIRAEKYYNSHGFTGANISVTEFRKDLDG